MSIGASEEEIEIVQNLLTKDFDLKPVSSPKWEDVKYHLQQLIQHLLNNDFERLLLGLYRIDVSEKKVKEILHIESPEYIAEKLTLLILERQHQKAATRLRYRSH